MADPFDERLRRFIRIRLPQLLKEYAQKTTFKLHARIEENFHEGVRGGRRSGVAFDKQFKGRGKNLTDKLYVNSGTLTQSFIVGRKQNVFDVKSDAQGLKMKFGTDVVYSRIHELGGIAGRGANIPKRPYFAPALKKFDETDSPELLKKIMDEIAEILK